MRQAMSPISGDRRTSKATASSRSSTSFTRRRTGRGTEEPYARATAEHRGLTPETPFSGSDPNMEGARKAPRSRAAAHRCAKGHIWRVNGHAWMVHGGWESDRGGPRPKILSDDAVSDPRLQRRTARRARGDPAAVAREPRAHRPRPRRRRVRLRGG